MKYWIKYKLYKKQFFFFTKEIIIEKEINVHPAIYFMKLSCNNENFKFLNYRKQE